MAEGGESPGEDRLQRLPEDMITEILVKLPVTALLHTRCVSPYLCGLTKSPSFINMYSKHHSTITKDDQSFLVFRTVEGNSVSFLSFHSYETFDYVSSPQNFAMEHPVGHKIKIYGSCNGLFCYSYVMHIFLCNPAIKRIKVLPPSCIKCPKGWELFTREAVGFGLVPNTDDAYIVVAFVLLREINGFNEVYKAETYDLTTNSWEEIDCTCEFDQCSFGYQVHMEQSSQQGTLFNGRFHWVVWHEDLLHALSLDSTNRKFGYFKLPSDWVDLPDELDGHPDELSQFTRERCLKVLNESLAFLSCSNPADFPEEVTIDIWVMGEYGVEETWTRQFTLGPFTHVIHRPLSFWDGKAILVETKGGQLVAYDLHTHAMIPFDIHGLLDTFAVMVYQESLVLWSDDERWSH